MGQGEGGLGGWGGGGYRLSGLSKMSQMYNIAKHAPHTKSVVATQKIISLRVDCSAWKNFNCHRASRKTLWSQKNNLADGEERQGGADHGEDGS